MSPPPDQAARDRIVADIASNLFVEAGAGAGKTSKLVDRILELVRGGVDIGEIAAITFTEKAAADLRRRLREELLDPSNERVEGDRGRFDAALDALDMAPIGTLHAFARRLLTEFPVEAGLPPGFGVLDELESNLAFDERWDDLLEALLADPDPAEGPVAGGATFVQLCELEDFGLTKTFRRVAVGFHENWDLVHQRVDLTPPAAWEPDVAALAAAAEAVCVVDVPPGDRQEECLAKLARLTATLREATTMIDRLRAAIGIEQLLNNPTRIGAKANWKRFSSEAALDDLRERQAEVRDTAKAIVLAAHEYRRLLVGAVLGRWVLSAAEQRAADGTVEFHDLLVLARRLVATRPHVRAILHDRYRRLLLDEFQDTDPIQLEIAVRLAAAPDDPAHDGDWTALSPLAGRLFIVGDPKQSIYRFRRADIAQYLHSADMIGAEREVLSANFRSSEPVITWVNHVFGRLITFQDDTQPDYQPLVACRTHHRHHGSVRLIGVEASADLAELRANAEALRAREAADAADAVATALHERWLVTDGDELRECRPGDITILLPARTSLVALETALRERDIPYRAENSSVVYVTHEVRHLMLALAAADDPTDELKLIGALRTGLYGCSDVELYEWRAGGGSWSIWREPPDALQAHPVAEAIAHVRSMAERSTWSTPADLIAALVDERRLLDAALDSPDARDVWRRIRFVIEQARAWSDAGGHGLRRYLSWVRRQATESRAADTILPEHDDDAVRIMTVHAAKGLEFPITIVTGLTTKPQRNSGNGVIWHGDGWTISSKRGDELYDEFKPLDEQMGDAERRRLLYVACTRAVDHLVVSLHRLPPKDAELADQAKLPSGGLLAEAGAADAESGAVPLVANPEAFPAPRRRLAELDWADESAWAAERDRALRAAGRRDTVSATRLAEDLVVFVDPGAAADEGLRKGPVDLELPPWQRGRYGTAIGRAVHGTLQFCDLVHGSDVDAQAAAQCAAEGIIGREEQVAALARSAIAAPSVQRAVAGEHHRELFVAAPVGDRVLEGYVDLLVRAADGWLIVDYKTDAWGAGAHRDERIARYRRQLAAYAVALEHVLGQPVVGGTLVHCRVDAQAEEIELADWEAAKAELGAAVAADLADVL